MMKNMLVRLVDWKPSAADIYIISNRINTLMAAELPHEKMEASDHLIGMCSIIREHPYYPQEDSVVEGSVYFHLGGRHTYAYFGLMFDAFQQCERLTNGVFFIAKPHQFQMHARKSLQGLVTSEKAMADYISDPTYIWK